MSKKLFTALLIVWALTLWGRSYGLDLEYRDYEVKKGDTLWDISQAELNDFFLWPNIWKENPEIPNPDLIYPSQHIRIPVYLLQNQVVLQRAAGEETIPAPAEGMVEEEAELPTGAVPREAQYLIDRDLVTLCGFLSPTIPSIGQVKGTPTGRVIVGEGDDVYLNVSGDRTPGRKFYSFKKPLGKVAHPKGGNSGYLIEITGIIEITGEESGNVKARITKSYQEVVAEETYGNMLMEYYEVEPPVKTDTPRTPAIDGFVVETRDHRVLNAQGDVLYLDKGTNDGVLTGDQFTIVSGRYPHIPLGKAVVILTKERTSTAFVTEGTHEILRGDTF